jgi:F-box/leucine-rich repeat protein 2/20
MTEGATGLSNMRDLQGAILLEELEFLNLNACQRISDKGIEAITSLCPDLRALSIYWIVGYIAC